MDGAKLGVSGKTYLHARVRCARNQALAAELDSTKSPVKVVSLADKQLSLHEAWPSLQFEKVNNQRASAIVGMFIQGDLVADALSIVTRIARRGLLGKLVDHVIAKAGVENCLADPGLITAWLAEQAKPVFEAMMAVSEQQKVATLAMKMFAAEIATQLEVAGSHQQHLNAIYLKCKQSAASSVGGGLSDPGA